jgi:hypothetical protein
VIAEENDVTPTAKMLRREIPATLAEWLADRGRDMTTSKYCIMSLGIGVAQYQRRGVPRTLLLFAEGTRQLYRMKGEAMSRALGFFMLLAGSGLLLDGSREETPRNSEFAVVLLLMGSSLFIFGEEGDHP